jgi:CRP/FNR family transcriptional regulator, cyclic AMP receptor protein
MSDDLSRPSLPATKFLSGLRPDDRDILGSYGEFIPALPGTTLITEGAEQPNVYFVISGSLAVYRDGEEIALLHEGDSIGEIGLYAPDKANATVAAKGFSQLWRINQVELRNFIQDNPVAGNEILTSLLTIVSERLRVG